MAAMDVPEPWASAMENVGAVSPQTGRASLNRLAEKAGVHATTISNLIKGRTRLPDMETITQIATALKKRPQVVASWLNLSWDEPTPYEPPAEAMLMDPTERETVDRVIRAIVRHKLERQS
ncbi:helix-turn-helix domain-containing protein, partial [Streptomyces massasporeus]